jgi:hypothetical protein
MDEKLKSVEAEQTSMNNNVSIILSTFTQNAQKVTISTFLYIFNFKGIWSIQ